MIKIRLSAFSHEGSDKEIEFRENENLSSIVSRAMSENDLEGREEYFQVLVNGLRIPKDFWAVTIIKSEDTVLIAPIVSGGSFGEIFKMVAVIVVTVVASAYGQAWVGSAVGGALIGAGAAIGTSLLLNSLIPPPVPGGFGGGLGSSSFESSQMYAISSQSNAVKKFGMVPKVYGTHRMFPLVAANPYTEVETDPSTGDLVQYFYAIYDFGMGPAIVSDLRIGESPITDYADVSYRFVDPNRPNVSEGVWDDLLDNEFEFYKGDSQIESLGLFIDQNQEEGGALEDYQIVRSAATNPSGDKQEIILTFINPQGLIAYGTQGETYERSIDLDIEFQKIGTTEWRKYNDMAYVLNYRAVGGELALHEKYIDELPFTESGPYTKLTTGTDVLQDYSSGFYFGSTPPPPDLKSGQQVYKRGDSWGYPAGSTSIVLLAGSVSSGDPIFFNGEFIGMARGISTYSPNPAYRRVGLFQPLRKTITFFYTDVTTIKEQQYIYDKTDNQYKSVYVTISETTVPYPVTSSLLTKLPGKFIIRRKETGQVYTTVRFTPREIAEYRVRVTRLRTYSTGNFQVQDRLAIANITTRFDRKPIVTDKRHVFLEMRIRATNQLNGAIQNLSGTVTSVLDVWNGTSWVKQPTSNPAWVYADLLTGQVNKKAIDKSRLHTASLLEWANFCNQVPTPPPTHNFIKPRFEANFVLDFETTLQSLLNQVSNASQASLSMIDGKYGVLIDKKRTTPVQVFTPRNSKDFSSSKNFFEPPHAVKVRYIDPSSGWELRESLVYADGYDETTATVFDELTSFACTNSEQAWRFGRYMMAQAKLRQETISISVDFEYLVCNRGDFVQITQDVMKVGGTPARVKTVVGNRITIDDAITTAVGINYGYVARSTTGIVTNTLTVVNSDTFDLDGIIPNVGDLIVIGEVGKIVYDCLVKSISPNDDLTARLILIEKADAVYDAESTATLPSYSPQISITGNSDVAPPAVDNLTVVANSWLCGANSFEHYIEIDWDLPIGTAFEYFEIYVDDGRGYDIETTTRDSFYRYFVEDSRVGFTHNFKIMAVSATGKKIELGSAPMVSAIPERKTARPANVSSLATNITGEVLQLDWEPVNDCIKEYLIRYSPTLEGTWEASIPLLRTDKNTTLASTQARTGTYLIKAVDFNDNESQIATVAITTIPELLNLNIISEVTDFPTLTGTKYQVRKDGTTLVLKNKQSGGVEINEYFSEGYYYYQDFVDLGDIYTARLQSLIQAEGYTVEDIMSNWVTLSSVAAMANSKFSEWDVQAEYRATDTFNVMADWVTLSSIDPISEGVQDNWTEWRRFTMGDGTGRIFQFRLKLISNKASVTPRVFDGTIKIDMPDRDLSYQNLVAPDTGYEIIYPNAFRGPDTTPSVQITLENGQTGDYWEFDYKSLSGFKIIFYNKDGVAVSRVFDAYIKGWGRKALQVI